MATRGSQEEEKSVRYDKRLNVILKMLYSGIGALKYMLLITVEEELKLS